MCGGGRGRGGRGPRKAGEGYGRGRRGKGAAGKNGWSAEEAGRKCCLIPIGKESDELGFKR